MLAATYSGAIRAGFSSRGEFQRPRGSSPSLQTLQGSSSLQIPRVPCHIRHYLINQARKTRGAACRNCREVVATALYQRIVKAGTFLKVKEEKSRCTAHHNTHPRSHFPSQSLLHTNVTIGHEGCTDKAKQHYMSPLRQSQHSQKSRAPADNPSPAAFHTSRQKTKTDIHVEALRSEGTPFPRHPSSKANPQAASSSELDASLVVLHSGLNMKEIVSVGKRISCGQPLGQPRRQAGIPPEHPLFDCLVGMQVPAQQITWLHLA